LPTASCSSGRAAAALLGALAGLVLIASPAPTRGAARGPALLPRALEPSPAPEPRATAAERVAGIAARAADLRERAGDPGLRDEERDAFLEQAWVATDEALTDPTLKDEALRTPAFLRVHALLLLEDGEHEEALETLGRLRGLAGADPETHVLLALCFMELGRTEEAVGAYRRALELGVAHPAEIRARLAYAVATAGRREEGLRTVEQAVAEDPADYFGYFVRGWILDALERRAEAKGDYLRAVERFRDDADVWDLLAELYEGEGDRQRALECYREVVRIDPSDEFAAGKVEELGTPAGGR
jgi:tetratricopeptide (TPR) repeat protein